MENKQLTFKELHEQFFKEMNQQQLKAFLKSAKFHERFEILRINPRRNFFVEKVIAGASSSAPSATENEKVMAVKRVKKSLNSFKNETETQKNTETETKQVKSLDEGNTTQQKDSFNFNILAVVLLLIVIVSIIKTIKKKE